MALSSAADSVRVWVIRIFAKERAGHIEAVVSDGASVSTIFAFVLVSTLVRVVHDNAFGIAVSVGSTGVKGRAHVVGIGQT